jgi:hypothetical protein
MPSPLQFPNPPRRHKFVTALIETFGFSPWLASATALFVLFLGAVALLWIWLSAPPRSITITSGPPGSTFERHAQAYREKLAEQGITLNIVASEGSRENLQRLHAKDSGIDLGFVQGGLEGENPPPDLVSLGTIAYQPVWIFYRGTAKVSRLSELAGKRIGIGAPGSGVQSLARALLGANSITGEPTTLDERPTDQASKAFQAGELDAIFMMGDSARMQTLRAFIRDAGIHAFNFAQADAYVRRLATFNLNKIVIPQGGIDLGQNLPAQDLALLGPGVELIARKGLNSAVSDMVLYVAQKTHGRASLLAKKGEFPAPLEREFAISGDAKRFYKSGRGFMYDLVPSFWLANLTNRLLVVVVPFLLILIPAIRFLPVLYRLSVQLRIYRCYRPLLRLEREAETPLAPAHAKEMLERLDAIEADVYALKVPASFASQFYDLRNHVMLVRNRLKAAAAA